MNQKDREGISYILSEAGSFQEFREMLFEKFPKIKDEFDLWQECKGISTEIDDEYDRILEEGYGANWFVSRKYHDACRADPGLQKRLHDQSITNIQGD